MNLLEFIESFKGEDSPFGDLAGDTPFERLRGKPQSEIMTYYEMNTSVMAGSHQTWRSILYLYRKKKRAKEI